MSPTIVSEVPLDESGPTQPCVWCLRPTDIRAKTPFRPDLGSLPLHITCGAAIIRAYEQYRGMGTLDGTTQGRIRRLMAMPQLGSGPGMAT